MSTTITARELNQDVSAAKRATRDGPVIITDRGRPAHVLLSWDDFENLRQDKDFDVVAFLTMEDKDIDIDIEFEPVISRELPRFPEL